MLSCSCDTLQASTLAVMLGFQTDGYPSCTTEVASSQEQQKHDAMQQPYLLLFCDVPVPTSIRHCGSDSVDFTIAAVF